MKRLLYVLVCMLVICACDNGSKSFQSTDPEVKTVQPDSTKKVDSLTMMGRNQLGMMEVEIAELKSSVSNMQAEMSNDSVQIDAINQKVDHKMEGSFLFVIIIGFAILLIAIIVLLVKYHDHDNKIREALEREFNDFKGLNQKLLNVQRTGTGQYEASISWREIDAIRQDLRNYNDRLNALEVKLQNQKVSHVVRDEQASSTTVERSIYFGVNQGNKFTKELAPSDESVAFKGNKIAENEVEFFPQSWDRIKSFNSLDSVVKIKGSTNGSSMKVIKKGYAVKKVENGISYWQVVDPVEIKLV